MHATTTAVKDFRPSGARFLRIDPLNGNTGRGAG